MRNNLEDVKMYRPRIQSGLFLGMVEWVPADNAVIDEDSPVWHILDPAGAIDLLMPESTPARRGLAFLLTNISANTITVKSSGDAAFTTAISLATMESAWVVCTGHATAGLGWRATATAAST